MCRTWFDPRRILVRRPLPQRHRLGDILVLHRIGRKVHQRFGGKRILLVVLVIHHFLEQLHPLGDIAIFDVCQAHIKQRRRSRGQVRWEEVHHLVELLDRLKPIHPPVTAERLLIQDESCRGRSFELRQKLIKLIARCLGLALLQQRKGFIILAALKDRHLPKQFGR